MAVWSLPTKIPEPGDLSSLLNEDDFKDYLDSWLKHEKQNWIHAKTVFKNGRTIRVNGPWSSAACVFASRGLCRAYWQHWADPSEYRRAGIEIQLLIETQKPKIKCDVYFILKADFISNLVLRRVRTPALKIVIFYLLAFLQGNSL